MIITMDVGQAIGFGVLATVFIGFALLFLYGFIRSAINWIIAKIKGDKNDAVD